jgi:hypothetical protein
MTEVSKLRLLEGTAIQQPSRNSKSLPRHGVKDKFLKGPVPEPWLAAAAQCSGKAFQVAIALWLYAGISSNNTVPINLSRLKDWGVKRDAGRRGLCALEKAGLVTVVRHVGRKPIVTINEYNKIKHEVS